MLSERPEASHTRVGRGLRAGLLLWALLVGAALAAPWAAPETAAGVTDAAAGRHLPPGTVAWVLRAPAGRTLVAREVRHDGEILSYERLGRWQTAPAGTVAEPRRFVLGTDRYGRDVLARLLWGARVTLRLAALATALALFVGVAVGALAALGGGWVDRLLMRGVDGLVAFPRLFLLIAVAGLWELREGGLALLLGVVAALEVARVSRGELVRFARRDHALAARALGCSPLRVLWVHLLPLALPAVAVHAALLVGDVILAESALSFLGLGVPAPRPSWGNIVADGQDSLLAAWWVTVFPGLAITLTVVAASLVADGLGARGTREEGARG